jgi:amidohydrolase
MTHSPNLAAMRTAVNRLAHDFRMLSDQIYQQPETAFQEHKAVSLLTGWLDKRGFAVETSVGGLETAFVACSGSGGPRVAFVAEYDALPQIGHACGHNLIGAGAAVAAAALRDVLPGGGTVCVIGTPAEEGGGGKVLALNAGLFDGVDAALMFHPADRTLPWRHALASAHLRVTYRGVAAHAAKNPEDGRNALAALIQLFTGIDALRQHVPTTARIHGVIRDGGAAPNVVPDHTVADFLVREVTAERTEALVQRFAACAQGAALATGTDVDIEHTAPLYTERKNNHAMADRLTHHLTDLGLDVEPASFANPAGSSDIGNLSLAIPTIHPYLQVADRGTPGHSAAFRDAVATDRAHDAALLMVTALATLGSELITDSDLLTEVGHEFATRGADVASAMAGTTT